jgi:UDP-N-acetylmuramoyl-tripeptide--D-alanyl-D-alanine ligase
MKIVDALRGMLTPIGGAAPSDVNFSSGIGEILDREVTGFALNSREVREGEIFFALAPEDYARHGFNGTFADSHQFIADAFAHGALMTVARADKFAQWSSQFDENARFFKRVWFVEDSIEALQNLAHDVIRRWARPIIGITGSAGKTTTKDLTAHVLESATGERVLKTIKNFNTELGLPLSILQMETEGERASNFAFAVLEMGMSSMVEIARMTKIAPPDVGVELLVAPVHVEYVGSIENIARAKAQLIEGLKPDGTAVLNADDERVMRMRELHGGRVLTFGLENRADVTARAIDSSHLDSTSFRLHTPKGVADARLPLPGRHNLMNALAAASVATVFEIAPEKIAEALASAKPSPMRGEILRFAEGLTVVDDTYNSNPRSLVQMARAVVTSAKSAAPRASRVIIVAGEMRELGSESAAMHRAAGAEIARLGVDVLWGVTGAAREIIEGAKGAGMSEKAAKFFHTVEEAAENLTKEARAGDVVLVKGSRGVRMEAIIKRLREQNEIENSEFRIQNSE